MGGEDEDMDRGVGEGAREGVRAVVVRNRGEEFGLASSLESPFVML